MTDAPVPGWYQDPNGAGLRWWDGQRWTDRTGPPPGPPSGPPPWGGPGYGGQQFGGQQFGGFQPGAQAWGGPPPGADWSTPSEAQLSVWQRNRYSLITFAIIAVYIVLAFTTRIVFFGILPIAMSVRAMSRKEALAPVALGAAILGIVGAIAILASH